MDEYIDKGTCKICGKPNKWGKYASEAELDSGICVDCMNKPFPITSVCRADLLEKIDTADISLLDDDDMTAIASRMADAYCDEGFHEDLENIAENALEDRR